MIAQASPEPSASPVAQTQSMGGFDLSKLTPEQRAQLELAIVKTSQNPVGNITVLPFQNNFNYGVGPYARFQYNLNIQPVIPIMLNKQWNLVARTIMPVYSQQSFLSPSLCPGANCGSTFGIADFQEQLFFAPKTKPGQLIWGAGPILQFPAGSPQDVLGTGKWGAGINAVALAMPGRWVMGALVTQTWSYAGKAAKPDYSNFLVQPFVNYNLANGWALTTAPIITANWLANTNKWTIPVGLSVGKTFKAGDQLMSLSLAYYAYVSRPVAQPTNQLRIQWSLLWPVKRGLDVKELLQEAK